MQNVHLDIQESEFVSIIGPSGSGKSTLLQLIGALDRPTSGAVVIGGHNTLEMDDISMARLRNQTIGFVFQNFQLLAHYTVLENVLLPLVYSPSAYDEQKGLRLLERMGLDHRADHYPNQLSGGECQRAAIARALILEPPLLCADEPTGNLDTKNGGVVMEYLGSIHAAGTTIVLITHDMNVAHTAQRIIHIEDGVLSEKTR